MKRTVARAVLVGAPSGAFLGLCTGAYLGDTGCQVVVGSALLVVFVSAFLYSLHWCLENCGW